MAHIIFITLFFAFFVPQQVKAEETSAPQANLSSVHFYQNSPVAEALSGHYKLDQQTTRKLENSLDQVWSSLKFGAKKYWEGELQTSSPSTIAVSLKQSTDYSYSGATFMPNVSERWWAHNSDDELLSRFMAFNYVSDNITAKIAAKVNNKLMIVSAISSGDGRFEINSLASFISSTLEDEHVSFFRDLKNAQDDYLIATTQFITPNRSELALSQGNSVESGNFQTMTLRAFPLKYLKNVFEEKKSRPSKFFSIIDEARVSFHKHLMRPLGIKALKKALAQIFPFH